MDRNSLDWTGAQLDVIGRLAQYGKPFVVAQFGTAGVDSTPLMSNANVSSLLWGGYPGQDGGVALLNILQGKVAPAGRLPTTRMSINKLRGEDPLTAVQNIRLRTLPKCQ